MTAPVGTESFTTTQSKKSEDVHKRIITECLTTKPKIETVKSLTFSQMTGFVSDYALLGNGVEQRWVSDGGYYFINGELVGVGENKYQHSRQNACERALKLLAIEKFRLEPWRIFLTCSGEGFKKRDVGGSTGMMIAMAKYCGMTILENPTEEEFKKEFNAYLNRLVRGE